MALLPIPTVGEILQEEFLAPLQLSQSDLARAIYVPRAQINAVIHGRHAISARLDLLLCKFFNLSEGYWLRIQDTIALMQARRSVSGLLKKIAPHPAVLHAATVHA